MLARTRLVRCGDEFDFEARGGAIHHNWASYGDRASDRAEQGETRDPGSKGNGDRAWGSCDRREETEAAMIEVVGALACGLIVFGLLAAIDRLLDFFDF